MKIQTCSNIRSIITLERFCMRTCSSSFCFLSNIVTISLDCSENGMYTQMLSLWFYSSSLLSSSMLYSVYHAPQICAPVNIECTYWINSIHTGTNVNSGEQMSILVNKCHSGEQMSFWWTNVNSGEQMSILVNKCHSGKQMSILVNKCAFWWRAAYKYSEDVWLAKRLDG